MTKTFKIEEVDSKTYLNTSIRTRISQFTSCILPFKITKQIDEEAQMFLFERKRDFHSDIHHPDCRGMFRSDSHCVLYPVKAKKEGSLKELLSDTDYNSIKRIFLPNLFKRFNYAHFFRYYENCPFSELRFFTSLVDLTINIEHDKIFTRLLLLKNLKFFKGSFVQNNLELNHPKSMSSFLQFFNQSKIRYCLSLYHIPSYFHLFQKVDSQLSVTVQDYLECEKGLDKHLSIFNNIEYLDIPELDARFISKRFSKNISNFRLNNDFNEYLKNLKQGEEEKEKDIRNKNNLIESCKLVHINSMIFSDFSDNFIRYLIERISLETLLINCGAFDNLPSWTGANDTTSSKQLFETHKRYFNICFNFIPKYLKPKSQFTLEVEKINWKMLQFIFDLLEAKVLLGFKWTKYSIYDTEINDLIFPFKLLFSKLFNPNNYIPELKKIHVEIRIDVQTIIEPNQDLMILTLFDDEEISLEKFTGKITIAEFYWFNSMTNFTKEKTLMFEIGNNIHVRGLKCKGNKAVNQEEKRKILEEYQKLCSIEIPLNNSMKILSML